MPRNGSDTEPGEDVDALNGQTQLLSQTQLDDGENTERVVCPPPPTALRVMRLQSATLFQRLAAEAAAAAATSSASSARPQPTSVAVTTQVSGPPSKGKSLAAPVAWDPAGRTYQESIRSPAIAGCKSQQVLPAVKDDLRLLATGINLALERQHSDRQHCDNEFNRLEDALVTLTGTVSSLTDAVHSAQHLPPAAADQGALQHMQQTVSLLSSAVEQNENSANIQIQDLADQRDATCGDVASLRAMLEDVARNLAEVKAAQTTAANPTPRRKFRPISAPDLPFAVGQAAQPPSRPNTAQSRNAGAGKRRQQELAAVAPPAKKPHTTPLTLPLAPATPPAGPVLEGSAVVRFGSIVWLEDPDQLRLQVYMCGRVAWDRVPALYPAMRSVARDPLELGYVRMEFPNRELAQKFVDAWATQRVHAGKCSKAQAHIE